MAQPRTPRTGQVFLDPRGEDRSLRVTWHQESQLVVLSLWRDNVCAGTFPGEFGFKPAALEAVVPEYLAGSAARSRYPRYRHYAGR